uniref:HMG box domain-containing protein n=1 Tax=Acrobeloides nanus TaxID=290746 RepID=A0A914DYS3_9BILA
MVRVKFVATNKNDSSTPGTSQLKLISKKPLPPKGAYKYWYDEHYKENFQHAQMIRKTKDNWDAYFAKRCQHLYERLKPEEKAKYKKLAEDDMARFLKEHAAFQKEQEQKEQDITNTEKNE